MKTSHNILGTWFHINWNGDTGNDQHGRKWVNPDNPRPAKKEIVDTCLDTFNKVKEL